MCALAENADSCPRQTSRSPLCVSGICVIWSDGNSFAARFGICVQTLASARRFAEERQIWTIGANEGSELSKPRGMLQLE